MYMKYVSQNIINKVWNLISCINQVMINSSNRYENKK